MHAWMLAPNVDSQGSVPNARVCSSRPGSHQSKELDGYDWTPLRFPVDYGRQALESPRLRRARGGRGHVRPARHRQDPPGHRPGTPGLPGRAIPARFFTRRRTGHAAIAPPARKGRLDRELAQIGRARLLGHRRARIRPDRRGGAAACCSRSSPNAVRKAERHLHHPTSSSADGAGSSATPTWPPRSSDRTVHPRQDDQIRGRLLPQDPRPHAITKQGPDTTGDEMD